MNVFLFENTTYNEYYSCHRYSTISWYAKGTRNNVIGAIYLFLGIFFELVYLPFLPVLLRQEFRKASCNKIMFVLGVSNCVGLIGVAIFAGYFSIIGAVFCTHPKFNYIMGCVIIGCWATSCALCALLAFNRGLEVLSIKATFILFKGNRTFIWIGFAILYGLLFFWFSKPLLFSSNAFAHIFNPFAGMDGDAMDHVLNDKYTHFAHTLNNIIVFVIFSISFCIVATSIFLKTKVFKGDRELHMTRYQRLMLIQSSILCLFSGITAVLQVYMQFFSTPKWLIITMQVCFQLNNGCGGFVYLFFHKRLRSSVFRHVFRLDPKEATYNNGGRSFTQR